MEQQNINQNMMLRVGHILRGIYRIDSYLSSGGFGNTYVATNVDFEETCAIKEFFMRGVTVRESNNTTVSVGVTENRSLFDEQLEKFKKEARRMRRLKNPHIVAVHALFEENGTAYYVMDYIEGENLAEKLKRLKKPLPEDEVMGYLPQVLDALQTVHNEGIWHLDLKPANIMVDKRGRLSLIDFGASKQQSIQGGATTSTSVSYTNGFAPREQMEQNREKFGPWTDLYALGATLYNLLSNRRPPLPSNIDDDITLDKHIALPLPENVTEKARTLILHLMATPWIDRPKSVDEVLELMERIQLLPSDVLDAAFDESAEATLLKSQNDTAKEEAERESIAKEKAEKERLERESINEDEEFTSRIAKEETSIDNAEEPEQDVDIQDNPPAKKWRVPLIAGGIVAAVGIAAALLFPSKKDNIDDSERKRILTEIVNNNSDSLSTQETEDANSLDAQEELKQKEEQAKKQQEELAKKQKEEQAKKQQEELTKKQKEEQEKKRKEDELNRQCLALYNNAKSAYDSRNLKGAWSNINSIEGLSRSYAQRSDVRNLKRKIQGTALEVKDVTGKDPRYQ